MHSYTSWVWTSATNEEAENGSKWKSVLKTRPPCLFWEKEDFNRYEGSPPSTWTARRSNQSILKEINSEYSLEGLMLRLKLQYFGHLMGQANSLEKTLMLERASLVAQIVKNPPAMGVTGVRTLGWEDPLEMGKATDSSILAWRIPWTVESMGLQSRPGLNDFHFTHARKDWRQEEKGMTEDEMVGWHHRLNGHEFE